MASVTLKNLTKRFGPHVVAVRNVNLEIHDREAVVMVGPSGCGKTTTLRSIAGLEHPTEGEIYIGDRLVNRLSPADRDIAFVFQFYALYPHLSAYDNIAFPLRAQRTPKAEVDQKVRRAAGVLGIERLLDRKPNQLSSGDQQKVAIARAMVRSPQVFLMDEPLSNLDAQLRLHTRVELKRLQRELNTTMIYVTHDQVEAMALGDRIVVMNRGEIQQVGKPMEIYNNPANLFVADFIGTPPMNLVDCTLRQEGGRMFLNLAGSNVLLPLSAEAAARARSASQLVLGVRPEGVLLVPPTTPDAQPAEVLLVEPLGDENIVDLRVDGQALRARTETTRTYRPGERVAIVIEPRRLHLFDKVTGKALV